MTVYHYEIFLPDLIEPLDTKFCFDNVLQAINQARRLKKEHGATRIRIENNDNLKFYWIE